MTALPIIGLGFLLGLKHALDADHLIAVSTIVSERKSMLSSSVVGLLWGIGHTFSLLVVGVIVIAMRLQIPDTLATTMELGVAVMLIGLGSNVLYKMLHGEKVHSHVHAHGQLVHAHPHVHDHGREPVGHHHTPGFGSLLSHLRIHVREGKRSVLIGVVHGLAGSATLMLVVLATIPSPMVAIAYIGMFGLGSVGGMSVMTTMIGIPFALTSKRSERFKYVLRGLSGGMSVAFGCYYAWQIAAVEKLIF